jgi:D-3-phosphoglycerate dehydrogenase
MKVLIADKLHPEVVAQLRPVAHELDYQPSLDAEGLVQAATDADVLIVRSTKVTAPVIEAAKRLSLIIRAGAGVNTIDLEGASRKGISVCNCPGKNAVAVAELAVSLMLAWDRRLPDAVATLRQGKWDKGGFSKAVGFQGRTIGILGLGAIGEATIERLRGFKVKLVCWSRSLTPQRAEELGVEYAATPLEVAKRSSIVSVHVALSKETRDMLGDEFFDQLQPGEIFINTCRAEVVQRDALLRALERGVLVGTDVFHDEPTGKAGDFVDPVAQHPNLYGSHHIGASTDQSELDTGMEALRIVQAFAQGAPLPNCVNLRVPPEGSATLFVRHEDKVGVLAGVFTALKEAGISVQEMENTVFAGAQACSARIVCDKLPEPSVLAAVEKCDGVYAARLSKG